LARVTSRSTKRACATAPAAARNSQRLGSAGDEDEGAATTTCTNGVRNGNGLPLTAHGNLQDGARGEIEVAADLGSKAACVTAASALPAGQ
jgi:hypothetical protein